MTRLLLATLFSLAVVSACGNDEPEQNTSATPVPETASPTASTSPKTSPSATPADQVELIAGEDTPFPNDMALTIETGCWGCEGGPHSLVRLYRDSTNTIRSETILDPAALGYPRRKATAPDGSTFEYGPGINGLAVVPDASLMAVSMCIVGGCDAGGLGTWQADSLSVILRSTDGGVTWEEIGRGGPALSVVGLLSGDQVLTMNYLEPLAGIEFRTYPENQVIERPSGASDYPPVETISGEPLWRTTDGGLLRADGSTFIPARDGLRAGWRILGDLTPDKGSFLLSVDIFQDGASSYGLERYEMTGETPSRQRLFVTPQLIVPGWWSPKDGLAVVTIDVPPPPEYLGVPVPALLDLETGEYHLIKDPFVPNERPYQPYGRSLVDAVQIGPFARIVNTGSCLRIRAEPSLSAQSLDCLADGVLLQHTGETREADGATWLSVVTPGRRQGWASTAFLER
jgi:hypothetical protein